jgi:hypothetical protein
MAWGGGDMAAVRAARVARTAGPADAAGAALPGVAATASGGDAAATETGMGEGGLAAGSEGGTLWVETVGARTSVGPLSNQPAQPQQAANSTAIAIQPRRAGCDLTSSSG